MVRMTLKIDGMMCQMCQSHVNDLIRRDFDVKKVSSSFSKGEAVIICKEPLDEGKLRKSLEGIGYKLLSCTTEPEEEKHGFLGLFGRKK